MSFYRVTYKTGSGMEVDDYLLEAVDKADAEHTAKHKVDGSYGPTDLVFVKVSRVSLDTARGMVASNCVCWANDPRVYE